MCHQRCNSFEAGEQFDQNLISSLNSLNLTKFKTDFGKEDCSHIP